VLFQEIAVISEITNEINADLVHKYFRKLLPACTKIDQKFGIISSSCSMKNIPKDYGIKTTEKLFLL